MVIRPRNFLLRTWLLPEHRRSFGPILKGRLSRDWLLFPSRLRRTPRFYHSFTRRDEPLGKAPLQLHLYFFLQR